MEQNKDSRKKLILPQRCQEQCGKDSLVYNPLKKEVRLSPHTKCLISGWIKGQTTETTKLRDENTKTFLGHQSGATFLLAVTPRAKSTKQNGARSRNEASAQQGQCHRQATPAEGGGWGRAVRCTPDTGLHAKSMRKANNSVIRKQNPDLKIDRESEQAFLKSMTTNSQWALGEKRLITTTRQRINIKTAVS